MSPDSKKRIDPVRIEFNECGTPFSPLFQDVYYSMKTGIDESVYVYLEGSGFVDALQNEKSKKHFTVGEIGFGVGLNFLLTYHHFLKHSAPHQTLTYLSVEKYPVQKEGLIKLYEQFPELKEQAECLLHEYPVLTPGVHTLSFSNHRVKLILMLGDAETMFSNIQVATQTIDHWYWDGFAPTKNPEAFQTSLFTSLIPISSPNALAASFTSAGWVRRGLEEAGFEVIKRKGFGTKRECIQVRFPKNRVKPHDKKPWFSCENLKFLKPGEQVAVIGSGLSGTAIARALADRGHQVTLIDQKGIAAEASGNPAGLYSFQLSKIPNPISRFSQLSLVHFLRELRLSALPTRKGILRLDAVREKEEFEQGLATSEYPSDFYEFRNDGVYFPECGIVNPRQLCEFRSDHARIQKITKKIERVEKKSGRFHLISADNVTIHECDHVVYATGSTLPLEKSLEHPILNELPIKPVRGQIIQISPTPGSEKISYTLQDSGYITPIAPEISGTRTHCVGATYQAKNIRPDQELLDSEQLLTELREKHAAFEAVSKENLVATRVGYRLSTPDKLPMIGPLCKPESLKVLYSKALRTGSHRDLAPLSTEEGEWLFLGMSSRGITFSSFGAEVLAALMCGEILPIESDLWEHLHSARFIVRNLKKPEASR